MNINVFCYVVPCSLVEFFDILREHTLTDGGSVFFRNVREFLPEHSAWGLLVTYFLRTTNEVCFSETAVNLSDYIASVPRRKHCSKEAEIRQR